MQEHNPPHSVRAETEVVMLHPQIITNINQSRYNLSIIYMLGS